MPLDFADGAYREERTMTEENLKKYDEKYCRMKAALELKEPDRVPINISGGGFMFVDAGYSIAEINYDTSLEKAKDAVQKFLKRYDPDVSTGLSMSFAGEGPGHEMQKIRTLFISGMKDAPIQMSENSGPQFLEQVMLPDEEMDSFLNDYTRWSINSYLPRISSLLEPFKTFQVNLNHRSILDIVSQFSRPDIKASIQTMWEINDFYNEYRAKCSAIDREIQNLGYPSFGGGGRAVVPFDKYSDTFRGFMLSLTDVYEYEEEMLTYMERFQVENLQGIRNGNKDGKRNGKFLAMALHKGFDGMLSDSQYEKFYWRHLKECIETAQKTGLIAQPFCEGKYDSRLKYLADIEPGNVYYTFESVNMKNAKRTLEGKACIGGGFPSELLYFGKKQQIIDKVKQMLDDAAPGGGYIFGLSAGLNAEAKRENVEAMFDTVKNYGKY